MKANFLHYLQLIAAIPLDLKKKAATIEIPYISFSDSYPGFI